MMGLSKEEQVEMYYHAQVLLRNAVISIPEYNRVKKRIAKQAYE
jgi:hypothetical protein